MYKSYQKYKSSGNLWSGDMPEHWNVKKLKHLSKIQLSNVDKHTSDGEKPVFLCNYLDVYNNDFITKDIDFMEATATVREIQKFKISKGAVLLTKDSEAWDDIAVPAYVSESLDNVLCGYHLAQVRANNAIFSGKYLFRCLGAQGINDQFKIETTGVTRFGLGKYYIDNGQFPVPPINEQNAITEFLDRETARIDTLIEKKQRQIELLQEKRAALISHAVTKGLNPDVKMKDSGIEWLEEIPEHWELKALKRTFKILNGSTPKSTEPSYWDGDIAWATPDDLGDLSGDTLHGTKRTITIEGYESCGTTLAPENSLILSTRAPIGHLAIAGMHVCTNQGCRCLVLIAKNNTRFYYYQILTAKQELESQGQGSTFKELSRDKLGNVKLVTPHPPEQQAIADYLDSETEEIDLLINKVYDSIDKLREYRMAVISATVTGKIDIREYPKKGEKV